ncbi:hypothetical protein [Micromonospora sp. RL09-050-HVF-A]|nr:hypothetical protein [Micromonospora sp. RL09-050-HVF-A]
MELLWYVAYGSNLHAARLGWYLAGAGRPAGCGRTPAVGTADHRAGRDRR